MSTDTMTSFILVLLCIFGLFCSLFFGLAQFRDKRPEANENQLSMQFFSGITLTASAIVWAASAWNVSEWHSFEKDLLLIEQLPSSAAGIPLPPFDAQNSHQVKTFLPFPEISSTPLSIKYPSLEEYEHARQWLSRQLLESEAFNSQSFETKTLNLNELPYNNIIRKLIESQPELFAVTYYQNNIHNVGQATHNMVPIVFFPEIILGKIMYTPYQGENAVVLAKLVKSHILFAKNVFYSTKPSS